MALIFKENEHLHQEILKLQSRLACLAIESQTIEPDINRIDTDLPVDLHVEIFRQKCKQQRAELNILDSEPCQVLPLDEHVEYDLYKHDLLKRISQSKECQKYQENQKKNVLENIDGLKKINDELNSVVSASVSKYREIQMDKTSKKMVCERLQAKCTQLDKLNKELNKETSEFISKNFPLPDRHMFDTAKKQLRATQDAVQLKSYNNLLSLTEIVELLMKANADDPNNPYVAIDQRFWPPFVELLLECDIVVRHTADTRLIKLVPFHL